MTTLNLLFQKWRDHPSTSLPPVRLSATADTGQQREFVKHNSKEKAAVNAFPCFQRDVTIILFFLCQQSICPTPLWQPLTALAHHGQDPCTNPTQVLIQLQHCKIATFHRICQTPCILESPQQSQWIIGVWLPGHSSRCGRLLIQSLGLSRGSSLMFTIRELGKMRPNKAKDTIWILRPSPRDETVPAFIGGNSMQEVLLNGRLGEAAALLACVTVSLCQMCHCCVAKVSVVTIFQVSVCHQSHCRRNRHVCVSPMSQYHRSRTWHQAEVTVTCILHRRSGINVMSGASQNSPSQSPSQKSLSSQQSRLCAPSTS